MKNIARLENEQARSQQAEKRLLATSDSSITGRSHGAILTQRHSRSQQMLTRSKATGSRDTCLITGNLGGIAMSTLTNTFADISKEHITVVDLTESGPED